MLRLRNDDPLARALTAAIQTGDLAVIERLLSEHPDLAVGAFEVLVKAGADIEALGGSIEGGTPLDNAVGYGQWQVARRLVECGAGAKLWHAAALGLMSRVEAEFADDSAPSPDEVTVAFYQRAPAVSAPSNWPPKA
jgi:hypothetical protein